MQAGIKYVDQMYPNFHPLQTDSRWRPGVGNDDENKKKILKNLKP